MPTQHVSVATMKIGKKGGGKHWTEKEIDARQQAADELSRKDGAVITPPLWLNDEALELWKKKLAEIAGLNAGNELLDALDSEILALYCDAVVLYRKISQKKRLKLDDHKLMQTYMLRIGGYAERLGFTPGARARLVKKRADGKEPDEFGKMFD
jgi:phage terminase small subunit